ncbi:hypothetical protein ZTR_10056 [Talaromyces verruculosus]|nr:hypothetical protein ZTR_10056 [Talaromyces verruculosus]
MASKAKAPAEIEKASRLAHIPRCEEYDKMISGMLYDSFVPELESARLKARIFMNEYNTWFPNGEDLTLQKLADDRLKLLKTRLGHIGEDSYIEPPLNVDYGPNISIGKRFYSNFGLTILDSAIVTIGDRVMFGPNVMISTATHETEVASRRDNIEFAKPVTIGDDCWIGAGVIILAGVSIGNGCTIGAGAIVTRDIPAWTVAVGSPAKVIKTVKELPPLEDMPIDTRN